MEIRTSLDWASCRYQLAQIAMKIGAAAETRRLLYNIDKMVAQLGNEEVSAKREKKDSTRKSRELVEQVNEQIAIIEQHLTMIALTKGFV